MKAIWDTEAMKAQRQVAAYIRKEFGVKRAKKFRKEVDDTVNQLMRSPGIGQIDPLFSDRTRTYRSVIINGLNKLVYFVSNDVLYIAGFWDTRMDDEDQATKVKEPADTYPLQIISAKTSKDGLGGLRFVSGQRESLRNQGKKE